MQFRASLHHYRLSHDSYPHKRIPAERQEQPLHARYPPQVSLSLVVTPNASVPPSSNMREFHRDALHRAETVPDMCSHWTFRLELYLPFCPAECPTVRLETPQPLCHPSSERQQLLLYSASNYLFTDSDLRIPFCHQVNQNTGSP